MFKKLDKWLRKSQKQQWKLFKLLRPKKVKKDVDKRKDP